MNQDEFKVKVLPLFEERLSQLLTFPSPPESSLYEAARYITLGDGKRLRPLLLLATVAAFNGNLEAALSPACSLEMLHTYSLVHDDLPCMDDDDYRRGKLTLHKKFNEAIAVLTGDFLLTYSFEILSNSPQLSEKERLDLVRILSIRGGGNGMIGGQILDLESSHSQITLDKLQLIHQKKTGDLITAALEMGGIIAKADPVSQKILHAIGQEMGLAFQIIDDVIDLSSEKHGKSISSDLANGKTTYISSLGKEGAKKAAYTLLDSALSNLHSLPNSQLLQELSIALVHRNK